MIDSDMKKITNLLYMLAVLLLASCSDFLDKSPKNTVDPETTVTDDVAIALTNACYRTLQSSNMYNQRIWTLDIVAGNSLVGAGGGTDGLETIQASNFITQSDNGMALYMCQRKSRTAVWERLIFSVHIITMYWYVCTVVFHCVWLLIIRENRQTLHALQSKRLMPR